MEVNLRIRTDILLGDLSRSKKKFVVGAGKLHRKAASAMLRTGVDRTPVDTGRLVSNWRVGLGAPTRAEIGAYAPGKFGSTAGANRASALSAGNSRINSSKEKPIFICNNTRYLQYVKRMQGVEDLMMAAGRAALGNMKVL